MGLSVRSAIQNKRQGEFAVVSLYDHARPNAVETAEDQVKLGQHPVHPPCSQELPPGDYYLILQMKKWLGPLCFSDDEL